MKKILYAFLFLVSIPVSAASELSENHKLASLCKVWGFLKYYHPEVAKGKIDWDAALIKKIPEVIKAENIEALNAIYRTWLQELNNVSRCRSCKNNISAIEANNLDLNWIYDATVLTPDVTQNLDFIKKNRNQGRNHYVEHRYKFFKTQASYKNEKKYEGMEYPAESYRLLTLFRYWNIINYFFPYKYVIGEDWNNVLLDMLPQFKDAPNVTSYHLAILELTTRVNDSHSWFSTKYTRQALGFYIVPFQFRIIGKEAIVTGFYNDSLAKRDDILYGDVILKIGGKNIQEVLAPKLKYIGASNYPTKLRKASSSNYNIFNGHTNNIEITFERSGKEYTKTIARYFPAVIGGPKKERSPSWRLINNDIGYVDMGLITGKEVPVMFAALRNTKGIIIDLRKPKTPSAGHAILSRMHHKKVTYAHIDYPNLLYPGVFKRKTAWKAGKKNKEYYRGQVAILFNEGTQSIGEFECMAFQTLPKVISIGSQTAGADGNIMLINLPGGYQTAITGLGIYYPDGRATQRIGIVPDIEVKPTIAGLKQGKDEVLERGIAYINTGK